MKQYKTLENWKSYEKGAVVPEDMAKQFLENYVYFEDQSILEVIEVEERKEELKVEVAEPIKKEVKKATKKQY